MSNQELTNIVKRLSEQLKKSDGRKDEAIATDLMHLMRQTSLALLDERNASDFRQIATTVLAGLTVPGVYGPADRLKLQPEDANQDLGWTIGGAAVGALIGSLLGPAGAEAGALLGALAGAGYSVIHPAPKAQ
jgi:hypothetical protein